VSKHRLDALTDGIFAVAMTLLVIELKLPAGVHPERSMELLQALVNLIPKFVGWVISFLVLALFWWGQSRAFHFVKHVNGTLTALNLLLLCFASFLPFASAISGEMPRLIGGQILYSTAMLLMAVSAWLMWRYLYRHPELCEPAMTTGAYREARFRTMTLMAISVLAVLIASIVPTAGNAAFMLMMPAGWISRMIKDRADRLESKRPANTSHGSTESQKHGSDQTHS
jgi:uncharacterized membrane protein